MPCHLQWLILLAVITCRGAAWQDCNAQGIFPGLYGNHALANLTVFKSKLLSSVYQSFNPAAPYLEGAKQVEPFSAIATCPPIRKSKQYGQSGSTAQFCDLSYLGSACVVYSVGPTGDYAFQQAVLQTTKCRVHTFDCNSGEVESIDDARHSLHNVCIGTGNSHNSSSTQDGRLSGPFAGQAQATLGQVVAKLNHWKGVDAAYVHLSGSQLLEFLSHLKHDVPLPQQLFFKLPLHFYKRTDTSKRPDVRNAPAEMALVVQHLAGLGYAATHSQVENNLTAAFSFLLVERVSPHTAALAVHTSRAKAALAATKTLDQQLQAQADALPRAKRLVVSMSSFPGRAEFANPTVYSIMHGWRKPDAFYFWIVMNVSRFDPTDKEIQGRGKIPDEVKRLEKQYGSRIKVKIAPKDYGPHTKLLPTLLQEQDPDTIIITVDDDTFYRPDTVLALEQEMLNRPGHAIVRSCEVTHWDASKQPPQKGWREWKLDAGTCRGFPTAFASAAYRRGFFDDLVFDQDRAPRGCLHHDDMWFGAHLWLRNIPIWVLPGFGVNDDCDKAFGRCWPVLYHRPKNRMSISSHPEADQRGYECLDYFKWMDDNELRKKMLAEKGLKPYKPFE